MKKNLWIILAISLTAIGCKKITRAPYCCTAISVALTLKIQDPDGLDLLDRENEGSILYQDTQLYYLIDGKREKQNHANLDIPKHFKIDAPYSTLKTYTLTLFLSTHLNQDSISTTILEYKDYPSDVITARIHKSGGSIYYSKA